MSDTFKFQKDWYEAIINDKYVKTTPQEMAYILYAAMQYAFNDGEPIDLGAVFGDQFGALNRSMPNIYGQMDRIKNYGKNKNKETYDNEAIYRLRMEGKKGKEICQILGYPPSKERSLSSTKGWKKATEDKKNGLTLEDIKNTDSVQKSVKNINVIENFNKNTVQNTESVQKSVKNTESVQKSVSTICTNFVNNTDFDF